MELGRPPFCSSFFLQTHKTAERCIAAVPTAPLLLDDEASDALSTFHPPIPLGQLLCVGHCSEPVGQPWVCAGRPQAGLVPTAAKLVPQRSHLHVSFPSSQPPAVAAGSRSTEQHCCCVLPRSVCSGAQTPFAIPVDVLLHHL